MLNFRMLLVLAIVCAGLGFAIYRQFPEMQLEAVFAGCIAFLAIFSFLCVVDAVSLRRRVASLESGLHEMETSFNRRINDIASKSAEKSELEMLNTRLSSHQTSPKPVTPQIGDKPVLDADDGRVLAQEQLQTKASLKKLANGSANGHAKRTGSGITVEGAIREELSLHLQPIVDVGSRSTFGFQVVPALVNTDGSTTYLDYSENSDLPGTLWNPRLDLQIFSKSIRLVRKLRQKAPDVLVFIPFSGSVFSDKRQFKQLKQEIDANKALARHCVLCIDANVWQQVDKSKRTYLVDLLDYGFQTAITNCKDALGLKKSVKLDQFSFYFASVSDLGIDASDRTNGSASVLQELAREHAFEIIVASVNHDYELIRLVDEDFMFAIGEYLSPAKAPNL